MEKKIALVAEVDIVPGTDRDNVVALLKSLRDRCQVEEKGTRQYQILLPDDPAKVIVWQVFENREAHEAHLIGSPFEEAQKGSDGLIEAVTITRYEVVD